MLETLKNGQGRPEIEQIVGDVFQMMLGLEVVPMDQPISYPNGNLAASVQFLGESRGIVILECEAEQARAFTLRMIGESGDIEGDTREVLSELANIVGGNLKAVFAPGMALSLPSVEVRGDSSPGNFAVSQGASVSFTTEVGAFQVSLMAI